VQYRLVRRKVFGGKNKRNNNNNNNNNNNISNTRWYFPITSSEHGITYDVTV
jgi:hypothetical protein